MEVWRLAIPIVVAIYLVGLLSSFVRLVLWPREMKPVPRSLVTLFITGGVVSALLVALWLIKQ